MLGKQDCTGHFSSSHRTIPFLLVSGSEAVQRSAPFILEAVQHQRGSQAPSRNCQALSPYKSPTVQCLSEDDDPEGHVSSSSSVYCSVLFTSGSWDFLSFLLLLAVYRLYFIWHLSLELWDGYLSSAGLSIEIPGDKPRKRVEQEPSS